jgi:uncharacterized protein (DUF1330 family)
MKTIEFDESALPEILKKIPTDRPVIMLNLLKYNETAKYPEDFEAEPCTGRHAYTQRYISGAKVQLEKAGASIIYEGTVCGALIGPDNENWDSIILVKYPSIESLINMTASSNYDELHIHRAAGLDDSRLIATFESDIVNA